MRIQFERVPACMLADEFSFKKKTFLVPSAGGKVREIQFVKKLIDYHPS